MMENKDCIYIKGRVGLLYYDKSGKKYELDSEICCAKDYDYAIYIDDFSLSKKSEKQELILDRILFLCEEKGMKPRAFFKDENGFFNIPYFSKRDYVKKAIESLNKDRISIENIIDSIDFYEKIRLTKEEVEKALKEIKLRYKLKCFNDEKSD